MATASRLREKQMVKELQKLKRTEAKEDVTKDVTADVFLTPAEEKPVQIQLEAPTAKVVKKNKVDYTHTTPLINTPAGAENGPNRLRSLVTGHCQLILKKGVEEGPKMEGQYCTRSCCEC